MNSPDDSDARIAALERENAALRAANARLMAERVGSANTAAAGELAGARDGKRSALDPLRRARLAVRRLLLRVLR
jgi:hypothetical protein